MAKVALMDENWKRYWYNRLQGRKFGTVYLLDRKDIPMGKCEMCDKDDELRPFGPKEEWVCFDCGMKNEAAMNRAMDKLMKLRKVRRGN